MQHFIHDPKKHNSRWQVFVKSRASNLQVKPPEKENYWLNCFCWGVVEGAHVLPVLCAEGAKEAGWTEKGFCSDGDLYSASTPSECFSYFLFFIHLLLQNSAPQKIGSHGPLVGSPGVQKPVSLSGSVGAWVWLARLLPWLWWSSTQTHRFVSVPRWGDEGIRTRGAKPVTVRHAQGMRNSLDSSFVTQLLNFYDTVSESFLVRKLLGDLIVYSWAIWESISLTGEFIWDIIINSMELTMS